MVEINGNKVANGYSSIAQGLRPCANLNLTGIEKPVRLVLGIQNLTGLKAPVRF